MQEPKKEGVILTGAKLRNIFGFSAIEAKFTDGANFIYGKNGSGKSTLTIAGLWACIKGIAEQGDKFLSERFRCIGSNGASGDLEYEFTDRKNDATFVIKNHVTKAANQITFQKTGGSAIDGEFLNDFFNVSLLSAKNFCRLKSSEQAVALGIDTSPFDTNIKKYKEDRKVINRIIKETGVPHTVEEVKQVDIEALKAKKQSVTDKLNELYTQNRAANATLRGEFDRLKTAHNSKLHEHNELITNMRLAYNECFDALSKIKRHGYKGNEVAVFLESLKTFPEFKDVEPVEPDYIPEMPDDAELRAVESEIDAAYSTNEIAGRYADYLKKLESIKANEAKVAEIEKLIDAEEEARVNYIKGKKFPFADLTTDEDGCLMYKGRPINDSYFSKGELEIIVAKLAASQNPLFRTRFIDEFGVLDPENQQKIVDSLVADGFQVIVSIPGERVEHDNAIVLRDCKIVDENDKDERPELL